MALGQRNFLKRMQRNDSLLDVMIQCEDFLDSLDVYAFQNWLKGTIVDGPEVQRYWVRFTLKYPYEDMPDPQGGMRMVFHGAKVYFRRATEEVAIHVETESDLDDEGRPKTEEKKIWLIDIKVPRRFIEELDDSEIEAFEDEIEDSEVDAEQISDATDDGVDEDDDVIQGEAPPIEGEPTEEELEL